MFDLKEEVIDDALGECLAMVDLEPKKDEVTVPAVHLIEASAGNDVGIGKIEQTGRVQLLRTHIAELFNAARERNDADVAGLLECRDCGWRRKICGEIEDWNCGGRAVDLGVRQRTAIRDGAREGVPGGVNVIERGVRIGSDGGLLRPQICQVGRCSERCCEREKKKTRQFH